MTDSIAANQTILAVGGGIVGMTAADLNADDDYHSPLMLQDSRSGRQDGRLR